MHTVLVGGTCGSTRGRPARAVNGRSTAPRGRPEPRAGLRRAHCTHHGGAGVLQRPLLHTVKVPLHDERDLVFAHFPVHAVVVPCLRDEAARDRPSIPQLGLAGRNGSQPCRASASAWRPASPFLQTHCSRPRELGSAGALGGLQRAPQLCCLLRVTCTPASGRRGASRSAHTCFRATLYGCESAHPPRDVPEMRTRARLPRTTCAPMRAKGGTAVRSEGGRSLFQAAGACIDFVTCEINRSKWHAHSAKDSQPAQ